MLVVDASAILALITLPGPLGAWAGDTMRGQGLCAPDLAQAESASSLRKLERIGEIDGAAAAIAYADLLRLRLDLWPFGPLAPRAWELRHAVTIYDATYIALAERLDAPLVTLDLRLTRANGPRCAFLTPPPEILDGAP